MRTTMRIDDEVFEKVRSQAHRERVSISALVNRLLRRGINERPGSRKRTPYREKVFSMGQPTVNLDKALSLAAGLEDEETAEKLRRRK